MVGPSVWVWIFGNTLAARLGRWARGKVLANIDKGRVPRPATGDGLGLQHQVVLVRWGGLPEFRPMRGDIDDLLSAACMSAGHSLQAYCATQVDRSSTSWS